jgi:hypothetical protein
MPKVSADAVFLLAFDKAIEEAYRRLAGSGLADEAIWEAFTRTTGLLTRLAEEIEDDQLTRRRLKRDVRMRRTLTAGIRKLHAAKRLVVRKS